MSDIISYSIWIILNMKQPFLKESNLKQKDILNIKQDTNDVTSCSILNKPPFRICHSEVAIYRYHMDIESKHTLHGTLYVHIYIV